MKAIITAAGVGSRLGKATEKNNKCLLKVHGKMLIEISVDILHRHGIREILVVTGHCYGKVEKALKGKATFVYNPFYQVSGILPSVWLCKNYVENDNFVFITGDSLYHPDVLKNCIKKKGSIVVCVEKKNCDVEDSKVIIKNNKIVKMGKNIELEKATGEFTGILKIEKKANSKVFDTIEKVLKQGKLNAYLTDVLMALKKERFPLVLSYTNPHPRIEIDYPEDLMKAKGIFKNSIKTFLYR
jgi:CDP-L-myo-inositol myo-inositolphosphotransferase